MKTVALLKKDSNEILLRTVSELFHDFEKFLLTDDLTELFDTGAEYYLISSANFILKTPEKWNEILEKYFNNNKKILHIGGWNDALHDIEAMMIHFNYYDVLIKYRDQVKFLYIGKLEESDLKKKISKFENICICDTEHFTDAAITNPIIKNTYTRQNKFLLTTVLKKNKHRWLLKEEIEKQNLFSYHIGNISEIKNYNNWTGLFDDPNGRIEPDSFISWDLYNSSSFEIVPETRANYFTYPTEKTIKPIMAKLPFLILSNKDYYSHLKQFGFKTFDSLIDESFAYEDDLEIRVRKLVQTAKHILDNDAIDFYNASQEICEYNREHMFYFAKKQENMYYQNVYNFFNKLD